MTLFLIIFTALPAVPQDAPVKSQLRLSTALPQESNVESRLRLGAFLSKEFERKARISVDPVVVALVERVGQSIVRSSDVAIPVVFRVIEAPEINVAVLPGGRVYVTTGLILTASTEAEFASALAHGIAKVDASPLPISIGLTQAAFFLEAQLSDLTPNSILGEVALLGPEFVREQVEAADSRGIQYLYQARYDPGAAVDLLQKIEAVSVVKAGSNKSPSVFVTHPPLSQRIKKLTSSLGKLPLRESNLTTTQEFDEVRHKLTSSVR